MSNKVIKFRKRVLSGGMVSYRCPLGLWAVFGPDNDYTLQQANRYLLAYVDEYADHITRTTNEETTSPAD